MCLTSYHSAVKSGTSSLSHTVILCPCLAKYVQPVLSHVKRTRYALSKSRSGAHIDIPTILALTDRLVHRHQIRISRYQTFPYLRLTPHVAAGLALSLLSAEQEKHDYNMKYPHFPRLYSCFYRFRRKRNRQTDKQTDRQTDRQTDGPEAPVRHRHRLTAAPA